MPSAHRGADDHRIDTHLVGEPHQFEIGIAVALVEGKLRAEDVRLALRGGP